MGKKYLSTWVIVFVCTQPLFAMNDPHVHSVKRAPWNKAGAPQAFDATLMMRAHCKGYETILSNNGDKTSIIGCAKNMICGLSADGTIVASSDEGFDQYFISIFEIKTKREYIVNSQSKTILLSPSALSSSIVAFVNEGDQKTVSLVNFTSKYLIDLYRSPEPITKIALNAEGTLLAVATHSLESKRGVIRIIELSSHEILKEFRLEFELLNLALGKELILEFEDSSSSRQIHKKAY